MNTDIRLSVGFWQHPKTKKLAKRLGLEGVRSLQILWTWAAVNRPAGALTGMDVEDVELAADWQGEEGALASTLVGVGFLDDDGDGLLSLHDWQENNPWQAEADLRSQKASKAAHARWGKMREHAPASIEQCPNDAQTMPKQCSSNAPASIEQCPSPFLSSNKNIISCSPPYPPTGGEEGEDTPDIAFEQFADAYPADKLDKDAAYIAWKTLAKKRTLPGLPELFSALAAWQASEQWQVDGGQYVPLASNFLGKGIYRRTPAPQKTRASHARASPSPGKLTGEALTRHNLAVAAQVLAELEAEKNVVEVYAHG